MELILLSRRKYSAFEIALQVCRARILLLMPMPAEERKLAEELIALNFLENAKNLS